MKKLIETLCGVRYEKEFDLGTCKIVMQSLWKKEEVEVNRRVQGLDFIGQIEASKVPILARSLIKVDNIGISSFPEVQDEIKRTPGILAEDAIEKYLGTFDGGAIDALYNLYLQLREEREKEREKLINFTPRVQKEKPSIGSQTSTENQ